MKSEKITFSSEDLDFVRIPYGSPLFDESVALRNKLLRVPLGLEFTTQQIADEWDSHHLGLYHPNGQLLGSLIMKPVENGTWKMRQVVIDDKFQGKGLGKILVERTESYCRLLDISEIQLHARDTAVPFYLKLGYKIYGESFEEVGIPHRAMSKSL